MLEPVEVTDGFSLTSVSMRLASDTSLLVLGVESTAESISESVLAESGALPPSATVWAPCCRKSVIETIWPLRITTSLLPSTPLSGLRPIAVRASSIVTRPFTMFCTVCVACVSGSVPEVGMMRSKVTPLAPILCRKSPNRRLVSCCTGEMPVR